MLLRFLMLNDLSTSEVGLRGLIFHVGKFFSMVTRVLFVLVLVLAPILSIKEPGFLIVLAIAGPGSLILLGACEALSRLLIAIGNGQRESL